MAAQTTNIETINLMADSFSHQHLSKTAPIMSGEASLNMLKTKTIFSSDLRAQFYSCADRTMLPSDQLNRIYELERVNDQLQRDILHKEHSINTLQDPFHVLAAEIEHAKMTIARNTGEILKIFDFSSLRIERIAKLERENQVMHQENQEKQVIWASLHDIKERSQIAAKIFLNKDIMAKNDAELSMIKREASC